MTQDRRRYAVEDCNLPCRVLRGFYRLRNRLLAVAGNAQMAGQFGVHGIAKMRDVVLHDPGLAEHEHEAEQRDHRCNP